MICDGPSLPVYNATLAAVLQANYFTSRIFPRLDLNRTQTVDTATLRERVAGDPIDERGYSTARVWYTGERRVCPQCKAAGGKRCCLLCLDASRHYRWDCSGMDCNVCLVRVRLHTLLGTADHVCFEMHHTQHVHRSLGRLQAALPQQG